MRGHTGAAGLSGRGEVRRHTATAIRGAQDAKTSVRLPVLRLRRVSVRRYRHVCPEELEGPKVSLAVVFGGLLATMNVASALFTLARV